VESKIKGLNLETLENGAHFFKNNTFKYNLANLSGDGYVFGEIGILNKKPRYTKEFSIQFAFNILIWTLK